MGLPESMDSARADPVGGDTGIRDCSVPKPGGVPGRGDSFMLLDPSPSALELKSIRSG